MLKFDNIEQELARAKRLQRQICLSFTVIDFYSFSSLYDFIIIIQLFSTVEIIYIVQKVDMIEQKKHLDCRRSYVDHDIFDILYPPTNSTDVVIFTPIVAVSDFVKKGKLLGHIMQGQTKKYSLEAPISGTIIKIIEVKPEPKKQKLLHIFSIKSCQHFPKDKNQRTQQNVLIANNSILHTADICEFCEQPIWVYYEREERQLRLKELKRHFSSFDVCEFTWRVVLNEHYTRDTEICETSEESYCMQQTGKITYLINFSNKQPNSDTVVLKYKNIVCKHEKISNGMCLFCLTDIKTLKDLNLRRYLFQYDQQNFDQNLIVSGHSLDSQALKFRNKMVQDKKLLLVLDLDNTILHSISLRKVDDEMIQTMDEYAIIPPLEQTSPSNIQKTLVKFRPNFQYFLSRIAELFEIFIYTKGTRLYAEYICQVVRKKYHNIIGHTKNFLPHRVLSRDQDPVLEKKSLDYIMPQNRQIMLILDDRRDVWNHSPLCVFTRPYIFFFYIELTQDGKTKLQPVEWQKGGGTLQQVQEQVEKNSINNNEKGSDNVNKIGENKKQIEYICYENENDDDKAQEKIVVCVPDANLQAKTEQKQEQEQMQRAEKLLQQKKARKRTERALSRLKQSSQIPKIGQRQKLRQKCNGILRNNSNIPDEYLLTTLFALRQAHSLFFQKLQLDDDQHKRQGKFADLGYCFQEYKKGLLDHLTAYFAFGFKDFKKSGCYRRAQRLGLRIVQNLNQHVDLIIRPNNFLVGYPESSLELANKHYNEIVKKIKTLHQVKKIPIVSETWIGICYEFNCCVHHSYFEPEDPLAKSVFENEIQLRKAVGQSTLHVAQKIKAILKEDTSLDDTIVTR